MSLPPPPPPVIGLPPPVVQSAAPSRNVGRAAGVALIVIGLAAGVVLSALALAAPRATVERFARARAGCTTTLQFERSGTYTLYVESKGRLSGVEGDCSSGGYEYAGAGSPIVRFALEDANGDAIATSAATARSYDVGAYRGAAAATVTIAAKGDYRLTVDADSGDVAVAVGGSPFADQRLFAMVAVVATLLGVLLGATLVLLNRR